MSAARGTPVRDDVERQRHRSRSATRPGVRELAPGTVRRYLYDIIVDLTATDVMANIGELEQLVLLALLRLGPGAYGAEIRRELKARAGRDVSAGTIYPTLDRLERKGLVSSTMSEPIPARGGRSRRLYAVEPAGLDAARQSWREVRAMGRGLGSVLEGT